MPTLADRYHAAGPGFALLQSYVAWLNEESNWGAGSRGLIHWDNPELQEMGLSVSARRNKALAPSYLKTLTISCHQQPPGDASRRNPHEPSLSDAQHPPDIVKALVARALNCTGERISSVHVDKGLAFRLLAKPGSDWLKHVYIDTEGSFCATSVLDLPFLPGISRDCCLNIGHEWFYGHESSFHCSCRWAHAGELIFLWQLRSELEVIKACVERLATGEGPPETPVRTLIDIEFRTGMLQSGARTLVINTIGWCCHLRGQGLLRMVMAAIESSLSDKFKAISVQCPLDMPRLATIALERLGFSWSSADEMLVKRVEPCHEWGHLIPSPELLDSWHCEKVEPVEVEPAVELDEGQLKEEPESKPKQAPIPLLAKCKGKPKSKAGQRRAAKRAM